MASDEIAGLKVEKLNGDNYHNWKFQIKMHLMAKDVWEIVTGDETLPEDASAETIAEERLTWEYVRLDRLVHENQKMQSGIAGSKMNEALFTKDPEVAAAEKPQLALTTSNEPMVKEMFSTSLKSLSTWLKTLVTGVTGQCVKVLRSDNGGEYGSKEFVEYYGVDAAFGAVVAEGAEPIGGS
eukprot:gene4480-biopygen3647